jgi:hypothetical protein
VRGGDGPTYTPGWRITPYTIIEPLSYLVVDVSPYGFSQRYRHGITYELHLLLLRAVKLKSILKAL